MKQNDLRDALSGIHKEFIAESDDFQAVSAEFRKVRTRKKGALVSALCLAFVGIGVLGVSKSGLLSRGLLIAENEAHLTSSAVPDTTAVQPEPAAIMTEASTAIDTSRSGAPLYYSKLVRNPEAPELDGNSTSAMLDVVAFDESMLHDAVGLIEGEILDIWTNQYEYATSSDKFEPGGRVHHKTATVAYTIKVDKVFAGDFHVGDEITVEDNYYLFDSVVSIKKSCSYVIPIGRSDEKLYDNENIVSGDASHESSYFTIYQFHPQIEKVDGGYIVPSDWKTLITDECKEIIMDIEGETVTYPCTLYYVPDDVFNDRINLVLQN
ncbi:MAG: hypothetical protein J6S92_12635 [Oscillospiraceae bacterium]|nr:hypothetical protein [Oscillospiraceae bacterium]